MKTFDIIRHGRTSVETVTEDTAPDWLTGDGSFPGSTGDGRWFWEKHVLTLEVGQSVGTDFSTIIRREDEDDGRPSIFRAATRADVCPDLVDPLEYGHHTSKSYLDGYRDWRFESENGRDRFVSAVQAGAFRGPDRRIKNGRSKTVDQKR